MEHVDSESLEPFDNFANPKPAEKTPIPRAPSSVPEPALLRHETPLKEDRTVGSY